MNRCSLKMDARTISCTTPIPYWDEIFQSRKSDDYMSDSPATILRQHLDLILERIESWPEPWAQDLADFLSRKIEVADKRASQAEHHRRLRSERARQVVRLDAANVLSKRPGIDTYQAINLVRKHTGASLPIIREEIAPFFEKNERFGSETHSGTVYASSMSST